jgi:hypothetical protein
MGLIWDCKSKSWAVGKSEKVKENKIENKEKGKGKTKNRNEDF